ncbi:phosphohistidine phosphatase SixA [bacterium]
MNVYLCRHGACEDIEEGKSDAGRRLTADGRKTVETTLPGLKSLIPGIDYILTSPLKRAVETADVIAGEYKCAEFVEQVSELADRGNEKKIASLLNKIIGKEHVVVVGHMPHLGELAQFLAGENMDAPPKIKKAGVAKIHIKGFPEQGSGLLRWVMTADELKMAGKQPPDNKS